MLNHSSTDISKGFELNGAEAIAEILKLEGVEFIACFPPTPVINAAHEAGIRLILTRKERVSLLL